jgi:hypothetical protein
MSTTLTTPVSCALNTREVSANPIAVFNSPLPNPKIWTGPSIGFLQAMDTFATGGWWHDSRILASTGEGLEKEEPKAWEGWWNEKIVELIQLSMQQKDALTVLLTGRSESGFSELLLRMVASRNLEFDLMGLKPAVGPDNQKFGSTMKFKQQFLTCLVETYKNAEDIRVYEDRPKHTKDFREFFTEYNQRQHGMGTRTRGPITAEVVQVADGATLLDPVQEVAQVQRIINDHNASASSAFVHGKRKHRLQIKKTVFYTGYLISETDSQRLLTLAQLPPNMPESEMKFHANNILITPRPCNNSILDKVGGMGNKVTWEVVGTAVFEGRIWAAKVRPVPENKQIYTDNPVPIVVLALRKGAKPVDAGKIQNWQPVSPEMAFKFDSIVGEKVILRIETEDPDETEYESLFLNKSQKRKHVQDDEASLRYSGNSESVGHQGRGRGGGFHQQNNNIHTGYGGGGRGGGGRGRGGNNQRGRGNGRGNGGGGRGRGRGGGGFNYRSL